jgi:cell division transport system permease protein
MSWFNFSPKTYLLRHLQVMLYSLGQLWKQPVANMMTVVVIGIALALPAGLYVLLQNVNSISGEWDDASQISLFLDHQTSEPNAQQFHSELKTWPDISNVVYQSASDSLEEFRQASGLEELLDTLPSNPIPAVIIVTPSSSATEAEITALVERLSKQPLVELAQLDMDWLKRLRSISDTAERGIRILALLLSLSVLLVIGNTIRLSILSRETEIKVIKLVGGTNAFVRRPFLYTGFWYGLLGGIVAWFTLLVSLSFLNAPINRLAETYNSQFTLSWFVPDTLLYLPLAGLSLGVIGAWLAIGRHLNAIEPS